LSHCPKTIRWSGVRTSRSTRDLGWTPQVDVEDGLRRTIEWFRTHPDLVGIS